MLLVHVIFLHSTECTTETQQAAKNGGEKETNGCDEMHMQCTSFSSH